MLSKYKRNPLLLTLWCVYDNILTEMTSYEELLGIAEDNFGLITSKQAVEIGISRQCVRALADTGRLIRLGHGVYRVQHHVPNRLDVYASAIALVGETGYLRGASVIALFDLCPTSPEIVYVGAVGRVRRKLERGIRLVDMRPCETVVYDGIRCQPLVEALKTARDEGMIEQDRIADAARIAKEKGLISYEECAELKACA